MNTQHKVVAEAGLEPASLKAGDFKSPVYTDSPTQPEMIDEGRSRTFDQLHLSLAANRFALSRA